MEKSIKVIVADNELSEREKLKALLSSEADIQVVGEARDGKECLDLAMRARPNIVLIKEDLPVINGLDAAEQITSELPEVGVILILTGHEGEEVWHKMLRAGIREFMTRPYAPDRLLAEIRKVADLQTKKKKTASDASPGHNIVPQRQVITVASPRGGCGKSLVATNLAVAVASQGHKVALVDLNLWGGDVAMLMDLTPRRTLGDLLPGFGGIDYDIVDSVMVKHASGVAVLSAPLTGTFDGTTLSRYMVQSILEALRQNYECTVVDTSYPNLESTLAAMDYSDLILVVVGTDLPRLRDGKQYLKNLVAANYPKEKIRVVLNRATSSREISTSEVDSILEFEVSARLPSDDTAAGSSLNLGQPIVTASPGKPLARALAGLVEVVRPSSDGSKKRLGLKWFSFLQ
jgi:pilus assembly protein CpaE